MLFSSLEFLFLFLPACLLFGLVWQRVRSPTLAVVGLLLLNIAFYAWFRLSYVPLIVGSIIVNYWIGKRLIAAPAGPLLALGVVANLALLGYFKYAFFFSNALGLQAASLQDIVLPLAISFYTFQQISFIVDCWRGQIVNVEFLKYALYVSFFPQLIAGPIVRFSELYPQLQRQILRPDAAMFAAGMTLFVFGLAKKVLIADVLARPVDSIWSALPADAGIGYADAWFATFAYSFQIYFDFSAYSDMAIGLGLMLGVRLPVNFLSPYHATNIRDFWQRWHITLSRWLRDYLYIPLGGNRFGRPRQLFAVFVTMALGGLWHGAGWNFVLWGVLHGAWIACSHLTRRKNTDESTKRRWRLIAGQVVTFFGVTLLWVFFRGEGGAWSQMFLGLFNGSVESVVAYERRELATFVVAALIVFLLPANARIFGFANESSATRIRFSPGLAFAAATILLFLTSVAFIIEGAPNAFIYFQF